MTSPDRPRPRAVFTEGSILRHVLVMTITGSIGLVAIFIVDFLSLLYISWLGEPVLTAGVGLPRKSCSSFSLSTLASPLPWARKWAGRWAKEIAPKRGVCRHRASCIAVLCRLWSQHLLFPGALIS